MNIDKKKSSSMNKDIKSNCVLHEQKIEGTVEFVELYNLFELAIDEIKIKLEILADELQIRFQRNSIHCVKSRLKTPSSIKNKLIRKGLEPNVLAAKENLTDIAGVQVICDYIDDIYIIEELLCSQDNISIIRKTDYIKNPKPNGYRSLHIVVMVPVSISGIKKNVPVEIQIRSMAMDFWASLEHQIYYKRGCDNVPDSLIKRLKECADNMAKVDVEMQNINKELQKRCDVKDEDV